MLVFAIDRENIKNAEIAISALIGILPPELKPRFDDDGYGQQTTDVYLAKCLHCRAEVPVERMLQGIRAHPALARYASIDPGLVEKYAYIHCTAPKKDGEPCGAEIVIWKHKLKRIPAADAHLPEDGDNTNVHPILFLPRRPRIRSLNEQMLRSSEYWDWVRIVAQGLEDQLRRFRDSVSTIGGTDNEVAA